MSSRRIILAYRSRFLREILKRIIEKSTELELVGEINDIQNLSAEIRDKDADWVILSLPPNGKVPDYVDKLSKDHPSTKFLAVATDGSQVKMKWLEPQEMELVDFSLDQLMSLLRENHLFLDIG